MAAFQPVKRTRMADHVFQQILRSVQAGEFKPGEMLPGERSLAKQFNVNRQCVREALRILEAQGIVTVRQGLGCYVSETAVLAETTSIWVPWLLAHRDEVLSLLDVREGLEVKAAFLAARHATDEDLGQLEQVMGRMSEATNDPNIGAEEMSRLDIEFHDLVARASKSPFLIQFIERLGNAFETDRLAIFAIPLHIKDSVAEHNCILSAIKARDYEGAGRAMAKHVDSVRDAITRQSTRDNVPSHQLEMV